MKSTIAVQFTRKRKQVTNYRTRLKLILSGKERVVIRKTGRSIIVQLTKFDQKGDLVLASANSSQLRKHGWQLGMKNIPAAYLTGLLAGKLALAKNVKEAVLDVGMNKPSANGRIYAALKGVVDAGIKVPLSPDIFPSEERINGNHITDKVKEQFMTVKTNIAGDKNG